MKVRLLDYFRSFLLHTPPYTSTFLIVQEWEEPVLVMRVEDLSLFQQNEYRARIGFQTWQSTSGTWVVAVPFCLEVRPQLQVKGIPCLNPRRAADSEIIQKFSREKHIRFLFLSAALDDAADIQISWPLAQRSQVRRLIRTIDQALIGEKFTSAFDPDFEQARQEFQALLTVVDFSDRVWDG
jgi:hypothetical protein